jgi:hypothetical protein
MDIVYAIRPAWMPGHQAFPVPAALQEPELKVEFLPY